MGRRSRGRDRQPRRPADRPGGTRRMVQGRNRIIQEAQTLPVPRRNAKEQLRQDSQNRSSRRDQGRFRQGLKRPPEHHYCIRVQRRGGLMQRRDFLKTAGTLAGAGALAGFPFNALAQKKITFKFDTYISETAGPSGLDNWFLTELEKRSGGQVNVRRYWAASLNKVGEHLAAVRDKTSEMSLISPGYYQADLPVTRGLEWYYRMERADSLLLTCRDVYDQFQPLRDEWEKRHKSKVMYWTNWNYAPLITRTPINSIEDFKGKRIRGYGVATDVIEALGGTAVPMAAPEVYTALERGVLDGVYGFDFITAIAYNLHEIAPHFTDIGDGPHAPAATVMNVDYWNSLPENVQKICDELDRKSTRPNSSHV